MSELAYLGLVLVLSTFGSVFIWLRQRPSHSVESGVEQFSKGLAALSSANVSSANVSGGNQRQGSKAATGR